MREIARERERVGWRKERPVGCGEAADSLGREVEKPPRVRNVRQHLFQPHGDDLIWKELEF